MTQTGSHSKTSSNNIDNKSESQKDSQRIQNQPKEEEGLFDFTAPKDPRANPIPNLENTEHDEHNRTSAQSSAKNSGQSSSRSQSKQGKPTIPKMQGSSFSSKSPQSTPHTIITSNSTLLLHQQLPVTPTSPGPSSASRIKDTKPTQSNTLVEVEVEEEEINEKQEKEDLDTVINDLMKGTRDPTTVSDDMRPTVISNLQKIRDDHLFDHDVDLAQNAHELATTLQNIQTMFYKKQFQQETEENIANRLENAQKEFQQLQQRCNRTMRLLKQKHRKDMEQLEETHINEMNEFVLNWQKPSVIRKYSSASSQLRHLRNQSIAMIVTRRFDDLRQTDKAAKALEQKERNEQFRQMSMGYDFQLHQLEEKQTAEKNRLTSTIERKEAELKAAIDWEIKCAANRVKSLQNSLEASKDVEKVWNLRHRNKKTPPPKPLTTSNLSKTALLSRVNQFTLNTVDLPPIGDPRAKSQHGFRRRMQAPVILIK